MILFIFMKGETIRDTPSDAYQLNADNDTDEGILSRHLRRNSDQRKRYDNEHIQDNFSGYAEDYTYGDYYEGTAKKNK